MAFKRFAPAVVAVIVWVGSFGGLVLVAAWTHLDYHFARLIGHRQNAAFGNRYWIAFLITYLAISIPAALASLAAYELLRRGHPRYEPVEKCHRGHFSISPEAELSSARLAK